MRFVERNSVHLLIAVALATWALACGDDGSGGPTGGGTGGGVGGGTGGGSPDASVQNPQPITVQGTVVDDEGFAYPGVVVFILGAAPVLTDGSGKFTFDGVVPPYDVYLANAEAGAGTLYVGLTRPDPWLDALFAPTKDQTATLEGTLAADVGSPFVDPNGADMVTRFQIDTNRGTTNRSIGSSMDVSPFSIDPIWSGASSVSGDLRILQYSRTGGEITAYHAYGLSSFGPVAPASTANLGTITMGAVQSASIGGTVTIEGSNYAMFSVQSAFTALDAEQASLSYIEQSSTSFSHLFPDLAGATGTIAITVLPTVPMGASGVVVVRAGLPIPTTDLAITVPDVARPLPISPAEGSVDIGTDSELVWSEVPGAVYVTTYLPSGYPTTGAAIRIVTPEPSAVIPDFAPYGVHLGAGEAYDWRVLAFPEYASTDAVAVPDVLRKLPRAQMTGVVSVGPIRALTTP